MSSAFASSAAVAIRNARFYTAEQQARQIAETLSAASAALAQNLEFEAVLNVLLDYLQNAIPYDAAFVILPEEETQYSVRTIRDSDNLRISRETVDLLVKTNMESSIQAQITEKRMIFVPDFRVKSDVVPGLYTTVWFQAKGVGEHDVYCTQRYSLFGNPACCNGRGKTNHVDWNYDVAARTCVLSGAGKI